MRRGAHRRRASPGVSRDSRRWRHRLSAGAATVLAAVTLASCSVFGGGSKGSTSVSVFDLHIGDCLVTPKQIQAQLTNVQQVPCTTPHTLEVYALVRDHGGSTFPTANALDTFANASCLDRFASYVGVPYRQSSLFFTYLLPSVRSWAAGDRTVVCVAETTGPPLRQSVKGSKL